MKKCVNESHYKCEKYCPFLGLQPHKNCIWKMIGSQGSSLFFTNKQITQMPYSRPKVQFLNFRRKERIPSYFALKLRANVVLQVSRTHNLLLPISPKTRTIWRSVQFEPMVQNIERRLFRTEALYGGKGHEILEHSIKQT